MVIKPCKEKMLDNLYVSLLGKFLDDVAVGSNDEETRPVVQLEVVPDVETGIVDAGVFDVIFADSLSEHEERLFIVKLCRVDPDKYHFWKVPELVL